MENKKFIAARMRDNKFVGIYEVVSYKGGFSFERDHWTTTVGRNIHRGDMIVVSTDKIEILAFLLHNARFGNLKVTEIRRFYESDSKKGVLIGKINPKEKSVTLFTSKKNIVFSTEKIAQEFDLQAVLDYVEENIKRVKLTKSWEAPGEAFTQAKFIEEINEKFKPSPFISQQIDALISRRVGLYDTNWYFNSYIEDLGVEFNKQGYRAELSNNSYKVRKLENEINTSFSELKFVKGFKFNEIGLYNAVNFAYENGKTITLGSKEYKTKKGAENALKRLFKK